MILCWTDVQYYTELVDVKWFPVSVMCRITHRHSWCCLRCRGWSGFWTVSSVISSPAQWTFKSHSICFLCYFWVAIPNGKTSQWPGGFVWSYSFSSYWSMNLNDSDMSVPGFRSPLKKEKEKKDLLFSGVKYWFILVRCDFISEYLQVETTPHLNSLCTKT